MDVSVAASAQLSLLSASLSGPQLELINCSGSKQTYALSDPFDLLSFQPVELPTGDLCGVHLTATGSVQLIGRYDSGGVLAIQLPFHQS